MSILIYDKSAFTSVADALREKSGTTEEMSFPHGFRKAILTSANSLATKQEIETLSNENVTAIPAYAFSGSKLKEINLPNVTNVAEHAFFECEKLESASIPKVETVEAYAFSKCPSLKSVDFPDVEIIRDRAFEESPIEYANIPNVKILERYAFDGCKLESIELPNVEVIGDRVFGVGSIEVYDPTIKELNLPNVVELDGSFQGLVSLESVNVPKVQMLGWGTFRATNITSFDAPELTTVDARSFNNCESLMTFSSPKLTSLGKADGTGGTYIVCGCYDLVSFDAPLVEDLGQDCFKNCYSLEVVDFPAAHGAMGVRCFNNCYSISSVNIPQITIINGSGITGSYVLRELNLPSVVTINGSGVASCTALKKVTLGSITNLAASAFNGCSSLETVIITQDESVCTLQNRNAFNGSKIASGTGKIYVPDSLYDSYLTATNWSTYAAQIKPMSEYILCSGISLDSENLSFAGTDSQTLTATPTPVNTVEEIEWFSSDLSVAYVVNGVVVPKKNGTATITAKCGSQSATCNIVVSGIEQNTHEGAIYQLTEGTAFTGESGIDTGIQLFAEDTSFTIFADVTTDKGNGRYKTIFHCIEEATGYPGYSMDINNTDNIRFNSWSTSKTLNIPNKTKVSNFKIAITHEAGSGSVTIKHLYNGAVTTQTSAYTWTSVSKNLYLGCFQKNANVQGRYWKGAIHDFAVLNRVATNEEITTYLS